MIAGVPGTGIGGLFYLAAAVCLPLRGLARRMRGERVSWPTIFRQVGLAFGILLGMAVIFWLLGLVLAPVPLDGRLGTAADARYRSIVRWAALLAGYATLALVMTAVQIARFVLRPRTR